MLLPFSNHSSHRRTYKTSCSFTGTIKLVPFRELQNRLLRYTCIGWFLVRQLIRLSYETCSGTQRLARSLSRWAGGYNRVRNHFASYANFQAVTGLLRTLIQLSDHFYPVFPNYLPISRQNNYNTAHFPKTFSFYSKLRDRYFQKLLFPQNTS